MLATHLAAGPQVAHDRTRTRSSQLPGSGEERERPPRLRPPAYLSSSQSSSQRRVAAEWEFRASRLGWSTPKEFPSLGRRRAQSRLACSLPGPSPRASSVAESKEGWGFLRAPGIIELLTIALQHCNIFRTTHSSHHPRSKAINMSANCATWTSERIELLKRCLHAGLSCGQTAREIGVTRNAVIGKMNRLGLSRPKDVIGRQLEQRRAARLARPKTPRTWRSKRPRLNIFAQHEMLMMAFRSRCTCSITSSAATTMFAVLRGRALSRLEIDDQLEFHGLLDWQAWMLDPAEFGGGCLRNLGPHGFDMFLPWGRRSSTVTWPKDECADEFFREPRDRSVPPPEWSRIPPARGPDQ